MHEVLVNRLGGLSLPRKSVVRLTDRPDMTLDVYRGRKITTQPKQQQPGEGFSNAILAIPMLACVRLGNTIHRIPTNTICNDNYVHPKQNLWVGTLRMHTSVFEVPFFFPYFVISLIIF